MWLNSKDILSLVYQDSYLYIKAIYWNKVNSCLENKILLVKYNGRTCQSEFL